MADLNNGQIDQNEGGGQPVITQNFQEEPSSGPLEIPEDNGIRPQKDIVKISLMAAAVVFLLAGVALGYLYLQKDKQYKEQKELVTKKDKLYTEQKAIVDAKTNCPICPEIPTEPVASQAPANTNTTKSTSSYKAPAQEEVMAPPAPPAD